MNQGEGRHWCPSCESDDISYDTDFEDGFIGVVCMECDTKWWEIWTFREISIWSIEERRYEEG